MFSSLRLCEAETSASLPIRTEEDQFSDGTRYHGWGFCSTEMTIKATSSLAHLQTGFRFLKNLSGTQRYPNMQICRKNHGNKRDETVLPPIGNNCPKYVE